MSHIAQRRFGQNFLIDKNIVKKIVNQADIKPDEVVIEIGPGQGAMTSLLAQKAKRVIAIELDKDLIQTLNELSVANPAISIVYGDALKCYPVIVNELGTNQYLVVANIPYNITSILIKMILQVTPHTSRAVLMVQKEVAQRLVSGPGEMSLLSLSVQLYAKVKKCFDVSSASFRPRPNIQSAVVQLSPVKTNVQTYDPEKILSLARCGFAKKRKLLVSNIAEGTSLLRQDIIDAMERCGVQSTARAQDLSVQQWIELTHQLLD
ncbi:MAG: 16S rRNA (adenine(1518)-N(6)/adenine(1519)-N(6))-dimethyltransferase RsmA [bacterium]|nr:16S rRNA (adenine(1518)-N(6)/adenine(1519)-N(6))-dimethyltransferase RsmA [bacterium]